MKVGGALSHLVLNINERKVYIVNAPTFSVTKVACFLNFIPKSFHR